MEWPATYSHDRPAGPVQISRDRQGSLPRPAVLLTLPSLRRMKMTRIGRERPTSTPRSFSRFTYSVSCHVVCPSASGHSWGIYLPGPSASLSTTGVRTMVSGFRSALVVNFASVLSFFQSHHDHIARKQGLRAHPRANQNRKSRAITWTWSGYSCPLCSRVWSRESPNRPWS